MHAAGQAGCRLGVAPATMTHGWSTAACAAFCCASFNWCLLVGSSGTAAHCSCSRLFEAPGKAGRRCQHQFLSASLAWHMSAWLKGRSACSLPLDSRELPRGEAKLRVAGLKARLKAMLGALRLGEFLFNKPACARTPPR